MRKYGYLIVEGPHDVEFTYRLLRPFGMKRVKQESELDNFFASLIPRNYPPDGDLHKRMPIPLFLQSNTHAVAIHSAVGDSQLVNLMSDNAAVLGLQQVVGIEILLDSDKGVPASKRYADIKQELVLRNFKLDAEPGNITQGKPKLGAFVLPDNQSEGTLEDLLLDSANLVYPSLLGIAKQYVNDAKNAGLSNNDSKDLNKPAGENKAIIGSMANILRPGKAVQVSIQDNDWLKENALSLPRIRTVQQFLQTLFELS